MGRMVRKQIYIGREQDELLKQRAQELGVSEAELVRRGIEHVLESGPEEERKRAWEDALAFMKERAKLKVPQTPRTWTRDELYDERPKYLSR
jgi:hypothetical protein